MNPGPSPPPPLPSSDSTQNIAWGNLTFFAVVTGGTWNTEQKIEGECDRKVDEKIGTLPVPHHK